MPTRPADAKPPDGLAATPTRREPDMPTTAPTASLAQPTFTDAQWHRFRSYGTAQSAGPGTWLFRAGQESCDMLLVESGTVDIVRARTADSPEAVVAQYGPGQFS